MIDYRRWYTKSIHELKCKLDAIETLAYKTDDEDFNSENIPTLKCSIEGVMAAIDVISEQVYMLVFDRSMPKIEESE